MPSFNIQEHFPGPSPDLILGDMDHMDCHAFYGISPRGKDYIAYLQETDDVVPLGNWCCRIARRDFDAYGFDLAHGRGLSIGVFCRNEQGVEIGLLSSAD